jgi:glycosyltransferase involved in cell wall biosynthesis
MPVTAAPAVTVSVVVPVYNEISTVRRALDALVAKRIPGYELNLIIVESNSTDGSREAVLGYRGLPRVTLLLEETPKGKGHAVRAGLMAATGEIIMIQDADLEYDLGDYEKLLAPIASGEHSFILGSRHSREQGWAIRKFTDQKVRAAVLNLAHWTFTLMINASLGVWLTDPFTMYKVFRRDCIKGLRFECNRFDFDWELLIKLVRKGYRPVEIPVSYQSRSFAEGKKVSMFRDPLTWMVALAKYRFQPL